MRTKTLLVAAAISVAGLASSLAQSSNVYSVNVVGYVNKTFLGDRISFVSNPLSNGVNRLATIFTGTPADNTIVFQWNPLANGNAGDFFPTIATYTVGVGWDTNLLIGTGEGFFVANGSSTPFTNTFVGEVRQGAPSVAILSGAPGNINMIGSPVPIGGSISNVLAQMPPADNSIAMLWDPNANGGAGDFISLSTYTVGVGWDVDTQYSVADGVLYVHGGPDTTWFRNFTVQ